MFLTSGSEQRVLSFLPGPLWSFAGCLDVLKQTKTRPFARRIRSSRSSLENDPLSCSHEQRGRFLQLPSTLNFLFHPPFSSTPQVFCFSEELGFCSLKSLLPVSNHGGGKVRRVGKIVAFPSERIQQSLMRHFYQANERRRWRGHRDQSCMFSLKFPTFDEQTCGK